MSGAPSLGSAPPNSTWLGPMSSRTRQTSSRMRESMGCVRPHVAGLYRIPGRARPFCSGPAWTNVRPDSAKCRARSGKLGLASPKLAPACASFFHKGGRSSNDRKDVLQAHTSGRTSGRPPAPAIVSTPAIGLLQMRAGSAKARPSTFGRLHFQLAWVLESVLSPLGLPFRLRSARTLAEVRRSGGKMVGGIVRFPT